MDVLHLTGVDYAQSIWAGGITRQIAIRPSGANYTDRLFLWRLSSARVDLEASDFTALPDYERHIAVLAGEIRLSHDGGPWIELPPFRVHAFDGAAATRCLGRCTDFNLMLRKGVCRGSMEAMSLPPDGAAQLKKPRGHALALYCAQGVAHVALPGQGVELRANETLLLDGAAGQCNVHSPQGAVLMLARIQPEEKE
mgnify:CR=1 FL=1